MRGIMILPSSHSSAFRQITQWGRLAGSWERYSDYTYEAVNHRPLELDLCDITKTRKNRDAYKVIVLCRISVLDVMNQTGGLMMSRKLIRYSMQIAMLKQLLALSLISEKEFTLIKNKTMKEYDVVSDLTS